MNLPHRALTAGLIAAAFLGGLTACGSAPDTDTRQARTHAVEPAVEGDTDTPGIDRRTLTKLSIDATWDSSTETDKDSMCEGILLFGPEWAADQMRDGTGDETIDWDYAAQLIEGKCDVR